MAVTALFRTVTRPLLDYALPPRCAACGIIVDETGTLCTACWSSIEFIGAPLCASCGISLPFGIDEDALCGSCIATPPPYDRARAVMRYGDVARGMAHRLKYGRRLSLAGTMASHIARLVPEEGREKALILPVPLHRWRIWSRGFNQAALIARQLGRRLDIPVELDLLRRVKNTPPLHARGPRERARIVRGAFALAPGARERLKGESVILIDDIWTTGATATACARLLQQAGAARIDILCWTRVSQTDD